MIWLILSKNLIKIANTEAFQTICTQLSNIYFKNSEVQRRVREDHCEMFHVSNRVKLGQCMYAVDMHVGLDMYVPTAFTLDKGYTQCCSSKTQEDDRPTNKNK